MQRLALALLAAPLLALSACASSAASEDPVCRDLPAGDVCAYDAARDADADLAAAMKAAADTGTMTLLVMGGNWCHDSRALAGHFASERFAPLLEEHYQLVYVDVGRKVRNQHIARRFGLDGTPGTPTVLVLDSEGRTLNRDDAPTWRNAASRGEDAVYEYFEGFAER